MQDYLIVNLKCSNSQLKSQIHITLDWRNRNRISVRHGLTNVNTVLNESDHYCPVHAFRDSLTS